MAGINQEYVACLNFKNLYMESHMHTYGHQKQKIQP